MTTARYVALIPAAGTGSRLRHIVPKQYVALLGRPMLLHVLDTFAAIARITQIVVVVAPDDAHIDALLATAPHLKTRVTVLHCGGDTRQQTVLNGLCALQQRSELAISADDWMLVHDAARPGLTQMLIEKLIAGVNDDPIGGLLALPIADTLKLAEAGRSVRTVSRADLWAAQTPQMFRFALLLQALAESSNVTDEASAIEALGHRPLLIEGSSHNFKVTLPDDIALATAMLKGRT